MVKKYIIKRLITNKLISEEEVEIYKFGLESLILKLLHCVSYLCIGIYLKQLLELIIIATVLIPLRRSAGGYHAKTKVGCYIFSCMFIICILLALQGIHNRFMWWIALAISDLLIIKMSPVDNDNKKLDKSEIDYYTKKSRLVLTFANAICIILTLLNLNQVKIVIKSLTCGVCGEAALLLYHKASVLYKVTVNR